MDVSLIILTLHALLIISGISMLVAHYYYYKNKSYTAILIEQKNKTAAAENELNGLFTCPITFDIIRVPALATDGQIYDIDSLMHWLSKSENRLSPITGAKLGSDVIIPHAFFKQLKEYHKTHGITKSYEIFGAKGQQHRAGSYTIPSAQYIIDTFALEGDIENVRAMFIDSGYMISHNILKDIVAKGKYNCVEAAFAGAPIHLSVIHEDFLISGFRQAVYNGHYLTIRNVLALLHPDLDDGFKNMIEISSTRHYYLITKLFLSRYHYSDSYLSQILVSKIVDTRYPSQRVKGNFKVFDLIYKHIKRPSLDMIKTYVAYLLNIRNTTRAAEIINHVMIINKEETQKFLDDALIRYATNANVEAARVLIKQGARSITAAFKSCITNCWDKKNRSRTLALLLSHGPNLDGTLNIAASHGARDTIKYLTKIHMFSDSEYKEAYITTMQKYPSSARCLAGIIRDQFSTNDIISMLREVRLSIFPGYTSSQNFIKTERSRLIEY